ncbi:MAG: Plug domain-containing protein [Colwellia sp.]|nr:Plug domain-containing protein [Colwellia sp.]
MSLNDLSGNQIRYFFDGIPMEDFGSALTFLANLVEQIEVYKGVEIKGKNIKGFYDLYH